MTTEFDFLNYLQEQAEEQAKLEEERQKRLDEDSGNLLRIWWQRNGMSVFVLLSHLPAFEIKSLNRNFDNQISTRYLVPAIVLHTEDEKGKAEKLEGTEYQKQIQLVEMSKTNKFFLYQSVLKAKKPTDKYSSSRQHYFDPNNPEEPVYAWKFSRTGQKKDTVYTVTLGTNPIPDEDIEMIKGILENEITTEDIRSFVVAVGPYVDKYLPEMTDEQIMDMAYSQKDNSESSEQVSQEDSGEIDTAKPNDVY